MATAAASPRLPPVSESRRVRLLAGGDHPPQVAALRRGDWVKLICGGPASRMLLMSGIAPLSTLLLEIVGRALCKIPEQFGRVRIEEHPDHLLEALQEAMSLVGPVKGYISSPSKPFS